MLKLDVYHFKYRVNINNKNHILATTHRKITYFFRPFCRFNDIYLNFSKPSSESGTNGVYVKNDREKIGEYFNIQIKNCGIDLESQEYCTCKTRSAMEMQTFRFDIDSVFTCCDCGKPVVLYELPYLEMREDHNDIQLWQDNYAAMDMLWLNCLCDRYTGNQRVKLDSALNKQGIAIAEYMSKQLGYPVYYHLECDYGKSIKAEKVGDQQIHICPKCGKPKNK